MSTLRELVEHRERTGMSISQAKFLALKRAEEAIESLRRNGHSGILCSVCGEGLKLMHWITGVTLDCEVCDRSLGAAW